MIRCPVHNERATAYPCPGSAFCPYGHAFDIVTPQPGFDMTPPPPEDGWLVTAVTAEPGRATVELRGPPMVWPSWGSFPPFPPWMPK